MSQLKRIFQYQGLVHFSILGPYHREPDSMQAFSVGSELDIELLKGNSNMKGFLRALEVFPRAPKKLKRTFQTGFSDRTDAGAALKWSQEGV